MAVLYSAPREVPTHALTFDQRVSREGHARERAPMKGAVAASQASRGTAAATRATTWAAGKP